jgi:hypothetical protein
VGVGQADAVAEMLQSSMDLSRQAALRRHVDLGDRARCVSMEIQL